MVIRAVKFRIIFLVLVLVALWSPRSSFAGIKCQDFYQSSSQFNSYRLPNPFNKLFYGIPTYASRQKRAVQYVDAELMSLSYRDLDHGQPKEYGVVKLLNTNKKIIAQSQYVAGIHGSINLNISIDLLLRRNTHIANQVAAIEITHTHPKSYAGSSIGDQNHHRFSESDFFQDKKLFEALAKDENWSHINVESYIVFLNSNIVEVPSGSSPEAFINNVNSRGYVLRR
jgi:hypothetical protein